MHLNLVPGMADSKGTCDDPIFIDSSPDVMAVSPIKLASAKALPKCRYSNKVIATSWFICCFVFLFRRMLFELEGENTKLPR